MAAGLVGPYRILERLGAGANGEVFLAEDTRLHRRVALKTLSGTGGSDAVELRRRMLREARAVARLNHPHIAAVYDVLESGDGVHIVMEYVPGATLAARVRQGPLPPMQVLDIALQLSSALAHAHGLGVVHRDLKPANVMVSPEGKAKILDFGLARLHRAEPGSVPLSSESGAGEAGLVVGTPPYMPPEVLLGEGTDARGDIYSLGVTLFESLTGRRPFEARDGRPLAEAILATPTPRPRSLRPDVPGELDDVVVRAMAREPGDRYATAALLESRLQQLAAGITDPPTVSRRWPLLWAPGQRRLGWTALACVGIGLSLYGAIGATGRRQHRAATPAEATASGPPVVAVLPLAGAAGDAESEPLAAGVAEALITTLSKVPGLTVVSRAATLKYRDRAKGTDDIARELGATLIVDGGLQRSGEKLRVTLSLLQPGSKVVRWQSAYDGTFAEVFTLQREVAEAVAGALRLRVAAGSATLGEQPTESLEAFADYAQARTFLERIDVAENPGRSIALFQSAIRRDPRFARAHGGLGEAYWREYERTRDGAWATQARDAINEALRLNPQDASVRYSLATVYRGMGRLPEAIEELRRVIEMRPSADDAHSLLGKALIAGGQLDAGLDAIRAAIRLRPQYWVHHYTLGSALYNAGRYRDAIPAFQRVVELQPDSAWGHQALGASWHALDDTASAKRHYEAAIRLGNTMAHANLGLLYYGDGQFEAALAHLQEAVEREPTSPFHQHNLADGLARLGRKKEATGAYRRAAQLCREELAVHPRDAATMATLAVIERKLGLHPESERHIAQALALEPRSPDVLYPAAVVHALGDHPEQAIAALREAVLAGYSNVRASRDPDLASLRSDPRYAAALNSATRTGGGT
jgi:eukaryotic-like serine/threonine-protein kinase